MEDKKVVRSNLNITIHNPNTADETSKMLVEVFAEALLARVERQLRETEEQENKIS